MASRAVHPLEAKAELCIRLVQKIVTIKSNTSSSTKDIAKANQALKSLEDDAEFLLTHAKHKLEKLEEEVALCQENIKEVEREKVKYQNKKVKLQAEKQKIKERCKYIRCAIREARSRQAQSNKFMRSIFKHYVASKSNYEVESYQRQLQSNEYSLEYLEENMRSYSDSISKRTKKINHTRLQVRSIKSFIVVVKDGIKLWELLESAIGDSSKSTSYLQKFVTLLEKERKIHRSDGTIELAPFLKAWNKTFITDSIFKTPHQPIPRRPIPRQPIPRRPIPRRPIPHKRHNQPVYKRSIDKPISKPKKPSKPCDLNRAFNFGRSPNQ